MPPDDIERWRREFTAKAAFFRERGIRYLIVIAPDKEKVYPEFLPDRIDRVAERTRFDQMREAFRGERAFELIDLLEPLKRAKTELARCYQRTDSHWNDVGGFVAAREILRRLAPDFPDLQPLDFGEFSLEYRPRRGGDLSKMLGFPEELREEVIRLLSTAPEEQAVTSANTEIPLPIEWYNLAPPVVYQCHAPGLTRRLLLASDSFGSHPVDFLATRFQRVLHVRPLVPFERSFHEALPALIEREKPDVYVEIFVERNLRSAPLHILGDATSRPAVAEREGE